MSSLNNYIVRKGPVYYAVQRALKERAEAERLAREEAERLTREEAEEAERLARASEEAEEAERLAREAEDTMVYCRYPTMNEIIDATCEIFDVTRIDMKCSRRTEKIVRPRQVAMYLCRQMTLCSLPTIGRMFGNRDHTTVIHAFRKIEAMLKDGDEIAEKIALVKQSIAKRVIERIAA